MQQLAIEQRRLLGPRAPWHVGDVAWGLHQHEGREDEWTIRLWKDGDRVVAWSWLKGEKLELDVRADRRDLLDEILAEPAARTVFGFEDDRDLVAALARHGFVQPGEQLHCLERSLPEPPVLPQLPPGFGYRTVEPADLAERVAVHRDVWAPSRVTESSYANVMAAWPYRRSLDCVVEAADGTFAAYCLVWPDDENRVGELEPVGVRESFRRRGLGAAVCTYALQRLYEEGGRQAIVYCDAEPACELYRSLGFQVHGTIVGWSR
jgi:ribosomal protein S18 acetylase RimI-like enzyme